MNELLSGDLKGFLQRRDVRTFHPEVYPSPDGGHFLLLRRPVAIFEFFDDETKAKISESELKVADRFLANPGHCVVHVADLTGSGTPHMGIIICNGFRAHEKNGTFLLVADTPCARDYMAVFIYHSLEHDKAPNAFCRDDYDQATPEERQAIMAPIYKRIAAAKPPNEPAEPNP